MGKKEIKQGDVFVWINGEYKRVKLGANVLHDGQVRITTEGFDLDKRLDFQVADAVASSMITSIEENKDE